MEKSEGTVVGYFPCIFSFGYWSNFRDFPDVWEGTSFDRDIEHVTQRLDQVFFATLVNVWRYTIGTDSHRHQ